MRVILQRVHSSAVSIDGKAIAKINRGFNLLVGISVTDTETELERK